MNKIISIILNFLLILGVVACSNQATSPSNGLGLPEYDAGNPSISNSQASEQELPKRCLGPQGAGRGPLDDQKLTQQESVISSEQFSKIGDTVTNPIGKLKLLKKVKPKKIITDSTSPVQIFLHEVLLLSATELTPKARKSISMGEPDGQRLNLLQIAVRVENSSNENLEYRGIHIPFCGYMISEGGKILESTNIGNTLDWIESTIIPARSKKEMVFFIILKDTPYPKFPLDLSNATDITLRTSEIVTQYTDKTVAEVKNVPLAFD